MDAEAGWGLGPWRVGWRIGGLGKLGSVRGEGGCV